MEMLSENTDHGTLQPDYFNNKTIARGEKDMEVGPLINRNIRNAVTPKRSPIPISGHYHHSLIATPALGNH